MAKSITPVRTVFQNIDRLDSRAFDVESLADGSVLFAFGGSIMRDSVVYTARLEGDTLGPLTTQVIPVNDGSGTPVSTLRKIEIDALRGDDAVLTMHLFNTTVGNDPNFALATQIYDGPAPRGAPRPVNPGLAAEDTHEVFDTLALKNGTFATFHSSPGASVTDLSNGIFMTRFKANGTILAGPVKVIDDRVILSFGSFTLENNPEKPEVVLMKNGNIGVMYTEKNVSGNGILKFQEITPDGAPVGDAVSLGLGLDPRMVVLAGGRIVTIAANNAQFLNAQGDLLGQPFSVFPDALTTRHITDIVALGNGGFAVSWFEPGNGLTKARMFDGAGNPTTNAFDLVDTIGTFTLLNHARLVAQGNNLMTVAAGLKGADYVVDAQVFDGAGSLGRFEKGTRAADTFAGTAVEDVLNGANGRDSLSGNGGNDVLDGGAGNDRLDGGGGADTVLGGAGNDRVAGGEGADVLGGGDGRDTLDGGGGADRLFGGPGADVLRGGGGADQFVFVSGAEAGDTIRDFNAAEGDKIVVLRSAFFNSLLTVGETLDPAQLGFFFETSTGRLTYEADGAGPQPGILVATLEGVSSLTQEDILPLLII